MAARDHFRAYERRRVEFPATLRIHERLRHDVRVRDLGLGGAGIEIPEASAGERGPLDPELPVTIDLQAPTLWDPLVIGGKIAWIKRGGQGRWMRAGVRFEHTKPAMLYALYRLLGAYGQDRP